MYNRNFVILCVYDDSYEKKLTGCDNATAEDATVSDATAADDTTAGDATAADDVTAADDPGDGAVNVNNIKRHHVESRETPKRVQKSGDTKTQDEEANNAGMTKNAGMITKSKKKKNPGMIL